MRKTIQITTKTQADKMLLNSLFQPVNGRTLSVCKLDRGKYKPQSFVGRDVEVDARVHAVYMVRRKDSDGPYMQAMCVTE